MARLFGRDWTKRDLLAHVGDIRQLAGAQPVVLDDGPERGVRAIEVRTGTGFVFWVLPDRGLDVWRAEYQGAPLGWISPTGPIHPSHFEPTGLGWLRGFPGGLITTCGFTYAGPPNQDQGRDLGLHGRASYSPATEVSVEQCWDPRLDEYAIDVRGKVREVSVFGDNVVLRRRISTHLGADSLWIQDEIENLGHEPAPHMLIYHVNAGFPVVSPDSELLSPSREARPRDREAEKERESYGRFLPPTPGFAERVYLHRLRSDREGDTTIALVNRAFSGGRGLGYALKYCESDLPCFTEWKMMGQGLYVVGTEPGNVYPESREQLRKEGRLPFLGPGEMKEYRLHFSVLADADAIRGAEQEIRGLQEN
jgi:hypothetical protein